MMGKENRMNRKHLQILVLSLSIMVAAAFIGCGRTVTLILPYDKTTSTMIHSVEPAFELPYKIIEIDWQKPEEPKPAPKPVVKKDNEQGKVSVDNPPKTPGEVIGFGLKPDVSEARRVSFMIRSDYPAGRMPVDILITDDNTRKYSEDEILKGVLLAKGSYSMKIEKPGYKTIDEKFEVPGGFGVMTIEKTLVATPRKVRFLITDDKTGSKIEPDKVWIGAYIRDGEEVKPGTKGLRISKQGYKTITEENFVLEVGNAPYDLIRQMSSTKKETPQVVSPPTPSPKPDSGTPVAPVLLDWKIYGDYPPNEEVEPEEVRLNGNQDISRNTRLMPGFYTLSFSHPAYQTLEIQKFEVKAGEPQKIIEGTMISKHRQVEISVKHDIAPADPMAYQFSLRDVNSAQIFAGKDKMFIKPGRYEILIEQKAYAPYVKVQHIWPAVSAFKIDAVLEAQPRELKANVDFDIAPPAELPEHIVTFIHRTTGTRTGVKASNRIKPGTYHYIIEKPGYKMEGDKHPIDILPSEEPFTVEGKMLAQPRRITIQAAVGQNLISPLALYINGKQSVYTDEYLPGRYSVRITFKDYLDVDQNITLPPGSGDYVIPVNLEPRK